MAESVTMELTGTDITTIQQMTSRRASRLVGSRRKQIQRRKAAGRNVDGGAEMEVSTPRSYLALFEN
jgi:hypothetical protein